MEKLVEPYDMKCMKMAILQHEETFKQQVYELHRLYQIQRMMMKNMQRSIHNQETRSLKKNGTICFEYHRNNYTCKEEDVVVEENGSLEIEDESEIVLTLGPTSRKNKPTTLMTTELNSDSMASFSSSSTDSRVTVENSRVLRVEEQMIRQADSRSLNEPSWVHQILI